MGISSASNRRCLVLFKRGNARAVIACTHTSSKSQGSFFPPKVRPAESGAMGKCHAPHHRPFGFLETNAHDGVDEAQFEVLSVSRRARSKLHPGHSPPLKTLWRGSRQTSVRLTGRHPHLGIYFYDSQGAAEGSPIDVFLSKTPACIPSRPSNSKSQPVLCRTALLPISHCHCSGTLSFQVNPCPVR